MIESLERSSVIYFFYFSSHVIFIPLNILIVFTFKFRNIICNQYKINYINNEILIITLIILNVTISFIYFFLLGSVNRIYGRGPKILLSSYIEEYFKFETSSRSFKVESREGLRLNLWEYFICFIYFVMSPDISFCLLMYLDVCKSWRKK